MIGSFQVDFCGWDRFRYLYLYLVKNLLNSFAIVLLSVILVSFTINLIAVLLLHTPPLRSLDYGTWGVLKLNGNATAPQKMGSLKRTVWQLLAAKIKQCCSEIAACSGHA